jgi:transcriptional regulator with XRE-family HTH domain
MEDKIIAARIADVMNQMGYNQQQFAEILGITQPAISNYLKGRIPPAQVLLRLAKLAQVSVDWILTGEDKPADRVSDSKSGYTFSVTLADKIKKLPVELQNALELFVDSMLGIKNQQ